MTALKKKSETCEEQLRRMCKNIAEDIEKPVDDRVAFFMDDVYDIEWITHNDHTYKAARLMVAGGGPSVWVNLLGNTVDGYWWGDHCKVPFSDNLGLDDYLEECEKFFKSLTKEKEHECIKKEKRDMRR